MPRKVVPGVGVVVGVAGQAHSSRPLYHLPPPNPHPYPATNTKDTQEVI